MGKIADILEIKGRDVHKIEVTATVFQAIRKMADNNVGSLLVMRDSEIVGILTERDYLRQIALEGRTSRETPVSEIMSSRLVCVSPDNDISECMAIMTGKRIRHLPVLEDGKLAGLVSIGDLVKNIAREQEYHIRYLTDYITGKYPG